MLKLRVQDADPFTVCQCAMFSRISGFNTSLRATTSPPTFFTDGLAFRAPSHSYVVGDVSVSSPRCAVMNFLSTLPNVRRNSRTWPYQNGATNQTVIPGRQVG